MANKRVESAHKGLFIHLVENQTTTGRRRWAVNNTWDRRERKWPLWMLLLLMLSVAQSAALSAGETTTAAAAAAVTVTVTAA